MENEVEYETEQKNPSLIGMITSPREQFERIRDNPKILVGLIVITLIALVSALLTLESMSGALEEELIDFTEDELLIFTLVTQITTVVMALVIPSAVILIGATVYFIIAKVANREVSFKQLFSLFTYVAFITGIGGLINALLAYFITGSNPEIPFTSLNILFADEGPLGVFLSSIDIFAIWGIILTAIGLQIVAKFSKPLAWGIVIGFNVLMIFFGTMLAIVGQSLGM